MRTTPPHPAFVATLAAVTLLAGGAVAGASSSSPSLGSALSSLASGSVINDPSCLPSSAHPHPVVILHGTSANMWEFNKLARYLKDEGYCSYGINYGKEPLTAQAIVPSLYGTADLNSRSEEVAGFIDNVLEQSGAEKVDIVAHPQGALQAKNYISRFGNADKVDRVVTMGASLHGTTLNGSGDFLLKLVTAMPSLTAFFASTAAIQQLAGSATMAEANSFPDTAAGVTYTSLFSPNDTTVTPNSASYFSPVPGANVVNLDAEAACSPDTPITHPDMPAHPTIVALTKWGLERPTDEVLPSAEDCAPLA